MGVKERREREKSELREKIMDAARAIFVRDGYDAVSMRKIAESIEYSPAAIYLHFPDKETLFRELCEADFMQLAQVFNELAGIADPVRRIMETGRTYIRFATAHPQHYRMMFMQEHPAEVELDEECLAAAGDPSQDAYAFLVQAVSEALKAGRFRPELTDAHLITQTLWAGVHGVSSLQITHGNDPWVDMRPLEHRLELMVESGLRGILRNPSEIDGLKGGAA